MIEDVVLRVQCSVEYPNLMPGGPKLIINRAADETGPSGKQYFHVERPTGPEAGRDTSKRQPPATLRTEISPSCDSTTPRAMASPRPAPPSSPLREGVPRQPASKTRGRFASGIPPQLSMTATEM